MLFDIVFRNDNYTRKKFMIAFLNSVPYKGVVQFKEGRISTCSLFSFDDKSFPHLPPCRLCKTWYIPKNEDLSGFFFKF